MNEQFPNSENKPERPSIKEGVDFVFEQHPELSSIGTKEQYSNYLETIFPESLLENIVYHGGEMKESPISEMSFFAESAETSKTFLKTMESAGTVEGYFLNMKNPKIYDSFWHYSGDEKNSFVGHENLLLNYFSQTHPETYSKIPEDQKTQFIRNIHKNIIEQHGYDSIIVEKDFWLEADEDGNGGSPEEKQYIVFEQGQFHQLGSELDMQKFKEFVG